MPPTTSQGPSIQDWEDIREVFTQLYEGRTLKDVGQILRLKHGFKATDRMYKKRIKDWGLDKNCKAKDMLLARTMVESREAMGKDSIVSVGGKILKSTKMKTYFRRARSSKPIQRSMTSTANVTCSTPEPAEPKRAALGTESRQVQTRCTSNLSLKSHIDWLSIPSPSRSPSGVIALRSRRSTSPYQMSMGTPDASGCADEDRGGPIRSHNIAKASDLSPHHSFRESNIDLFRLMSVSPSQVCQGLQLELGITQQIYLEIAAYFDKFFRFDIWKSYQSEQFRCQAMETSERQSSVPSLRLLDANETSLELSNPGAMVSLFETSSMLFRRGQCWEAGRLLNQAFETLRRLVQEQHPQLISCLLLLITILDGDGLSDLVDMLLHQLHDISSLDHGVQHPITRLSSLLARMHQHRPESAQQALTVISARFDQEVGADHPQYLRASYNLCWSFVQRGQYDKAKDRLRGILAAYERLAGIDHIYSRQALYALAQIYSAQGLLVAARETLEELLRRIQCRFGTEIPVSMMAIEALRMLAALHGRQSQPERMMDILASALEDGQKLLGSEHPIVLLVKHDFEDITELLRVHDG